MPSGVRGEPAGSGGRSPATASAQGKAEPWRRGARTMNKSWDDQESGSEERAKDGRRRSWRKATLLSLQRPSMPIRSFEQQDQSRSPRPITRRQWDVRPCEKVQQRSAVRP